MLQCRIHDGAPGMDREVMMHFLQVKIRDVRHRRRKRKELGKCGRILLTVSMVAIVDAGMLACGRGEELQLNGEPASVLASEDTAQSGDTAASGLPGSDLSSGLAASNDPNGASADGSQDAAETAAMENGTAAKSSEIFGTESAEESEAETESAVVAVYLCGAVEEPGVYELPEGSRVVDAIRMAGGLTLTADETCVNQARYVLDGEQIYIWTEEEKEAYQRGESVPVSENVEGTSGVSGSGGVRFLNDGSGNNAGEETAGSGLVNLNTATQQELMTLNGIGEAKAAAIVAYRQEHGYFSSKEELKNVSGIGDATYEKLQEQITTE